MLKLCSRVSAGPNAVVLALCAFVLVADAAPAASQQPGREADPVSTSELVQAGRELPSERSASSRTFRVAKGAYVTRIYGANVHEPVPGGAPQRLPTGLERDGTGYSFDTRSVSVRLPAALRGGTVRVSQGSRAVGYRLVGAGEGAPEIEGATATFREAFEQTDVRLTALTNGVKEDLVLTGPEAPSAFTFELTVPDGAKASLNQRGQITVDAPGDDDFVIAAPVMYDEARAFAPRTAARYALREVKAGYQATLLLDERWLRDAKRTFPVTVDPTAIATGPTQTTDASLLESVPDSGYGGSEGIFIGEYAAWPGYDNRGVLRFDLSEVPADAKVLQAKLGLKSYYTESSTEKEMSVHALTHEFTHDATWNDYDGTNAWGSAGGDFDSEPAAVSAVGASLGWEYWYPTELVQEWVEGSRENHGLLLRDMPGEPNNGTEFRSSEYGTAADRPYVDVMWHPRTGDLPTYTYDEHRLADGTVVKVNTRNGNVVYARPAAFGTGPGEDFVMGHYFNSMLEGTGTAGGFGASPWVAANGKWVGGTVMSNGDFIHQGLTGYVLPFIKQGDGSFKSPPELDATLTEDTGASWGERYELEFQDGSTMTFAEDGTWTSHTDPDENTYTLNYPSPSYQHTSVTGTDNEDTTFSYTTGSQSQDLLQTVTNPDDDTFTYRYTNDRLTGETYESSTLATYAYDGNGRLSSITDGDSNTVSLSFDSAGRLGQFTDGSDETSYTYDEPDDSCDDTATALTTVIKPDGAAVSTCFDAQGFELPPPVNTVGEHSGDLVVTPTEDPQTTSFATTSGSHVAWAIARMPATKTIDQVTLGDFGKATGCSTTTTASLSIAVLEGSNYGSHTQIALASAVEIPGTPAPVIWDLSGQVTLEKDKAYQFRVHPQSGCDLQRTTWAQPSIIDGGERQCAPGPERSTTTHFGERIWHNQGTAETECNVIDMHDDLPSGWYSTRQYGTSSQRTTLVGQALIPPTAPSWFDDACDDRYSTAFFDGLAYGLTPETYTVPNNAYTHVACRWTNYAPRGVKPTNGWHYAPAWQPGTPTRPRAMYAKLRSIDYTSLLEQYAPQLILDSEEDYHPDAWQTAVDMPESQLRQRLGLFPDDLLAATTPLAGQLTLTASWLVPEFAAYPAGPEAANNGHYLDFGTGRGINLEDEAETLRGASSTYRDKTYARAVNGSNGEMYLQYWFWYVNNHASGAGPGNHEGDWEFIQLRLDGSLDPVVATYSQHEHGETCNWTDVLKTGDGRPKVWPARNRHANYFGPGSHMVRGDLPVLPPVSEDVNDDHTATDLEAINVSTAPAFLQWPGHWGASVGKWGAKGWFDPTSPFGPMHQPTWEPVHAEEIATTDCTID